MQDFRQEAPILRVSTIPLQTIKLRHFSGSQEWATGAPSIQRANVNIISFVFFTL